MTHVYIPIWAQSWSEWTRSAVSVSHTAHQSVPAKDAFRHVPFYPVEHLHVLPGGGRTAYGKQRTTAPGIITAEFHFGEEASWSLA